MRGEQGLAWIALVTSLGTIPACAGSRDRRPYHPRRLSDHPRVRGEQGRFGAVVGRAGGPSPRARGAAGVGDYWWVHQRTIPACAGSSPRVRVGEHPTGDHPRVRGEQSRCTASAITASGPSPRARGAADAEDPRDRMIGTIPACAGSRERIALMSVAIRDHPRVRGEQRNAATSPKHAGKDHPRVRGEHVARWPVRTGRPGPSPRARGARFHGRTSSTPAARTIPACAGSSAHTGVLTDCPHRQDHPRVRGEHVAAGSCCRVRLDGPSPRARGAADAGPVLDDADTDHPRVRGEQSGRPASARQGPGTIPACAGSSSVAAGCRTSQRRTIPACAGSTVAPVVARCAPRDHPRVRGEQHLFTCGSEDPERGFRSLCSTGYAGCPRRPNRRRLAALLQPAGIAGLKGASLGRRIRVTPSTSTGVQ